MSRTLWRRKEKAVPAWNLTATMRATLIFLSIHDDGAKCSPGMAKTLQVCFSAYTVAQAFSHFTYVIISWEKRWICDIQGVDDAQTNRMLISDPAVHYYNRRKEYRKSVDERADLGYTGISRFFLTHECSELCKLVIHGLRTTSCNDIPMACSHGATI
jgi:hypothetical protein